MKFLEFEKLYVFGNFRLIIQKKTILYICKNSIVGYSKITCWGYKIYKEKNCISENAFLSIYRILQDVATVLMPYEFRVSRHEF